jgi:hypothetical protein
VVPPSAGPVTIALDLARGRDWVRKPLIVEVVGPGETDPTLLATVPVNVRGDHQPPITFTVQAQGDWMFLRIIDPDRPNHPLARAPFDNGGAFAYASPWFFAAA